MLTIAGGIVSALLIFVAATAVLGVLAVIADKIVADYRKHRFDQWKRRNYPKLDPRR